MKKTNEQFIIECKLKHGNLCDYTKTKYINKRTKVNITCPIHGDFQQLPNHHLKSVCGCPKCGNGILTVQQFITKAKTIHNDFYDYSKITESLSHDYVQIFCPLHGSFNQKVYSHLNGKGCINCAGKIISQQDFIDECVKIHNGKYDYSKVVYTKAHSPITIICPIHGEFNQIAHDHKNGKKGCNTCNQSKGEKSIESFLTTNNIAFNRQYRFENCKNINTLPFDFYIPNINLCIEFDGIQHYEPLIFFGGETEFIKRKNNDLIKTTFCKENNITLIRIRYDENIEKRLDSLTK